MHSPLANVHVMNVCMQTDMHTHELWVLWVYTRVTGWWKGRHQGISREFPTSCCIIITGLVYVVTLLPYEILSTCTVQTLNVQFLCMYMLCAHINSFTCTLHMHVHVKYAYKPVYMCMYNVMCIYMYNSHDVT